MGCQLWIVVKVRNGQRAAWNDRRQMAGIGRRRQHCRSYQGMNEFMNPSGREMLRFMCVKFQRMASV